MRCGRVFMADPLATTATRYYGRGGAGCYALSASARSGWPEVVASCGRKACASAFDVHPFLAQPHVVRGPASCCRRRSPAGPMGGRAAWPAPGPFPGHGGWGRPAGHRAGRPPSALRCRGSGARPAGGRSRGTYRSGLADSITTWSPAARWPRNAASASGNMPLRHHAGGVTRVRRRSMVARDMPPNSSRMKAPFSWPRSMRFSTKAAMGRASNGARGQRAGCSSSSRNTKPRKVSARVSVPSRSNSASRRTCSGGLAGAPPAGAARSAGCRRGGSSRAPWVCRCARAPRRRWACRRHPASPSRPPSCARHRCRR